MLKINNDNFLNESQIREQASSIFTTKGAPGTSEKYSHIPTNQIIIIADNELIQKNH